MSIIKKAGCVLIRPNTKEVALVYRDYVNDYSFPKGHIEFGENLIECAVRETEEETKRKPVVLNNQPIYIDRYKIKTEDIEVYYYLAIDGGKSLNTSSDTHPVYWVSYNDVSNMLTYDSSKNMWNEIKDIIIGGKYE